MQSVDFVKMDIESSEWSLLAVPRLADVRAMIALEWHGDSSPAQSGHSAAIGALQAAGFVTSGEDCGYSHGFIWAWRP